jgi:hypothetical protein
MSSAPLAAGVLIDASLDVVFHQIAYNLHITVTQSGSEDPLLAVDLEELGADLRWHGEFAGSFIEAMTSKTGSFKSFDVFAKMLQGALWQQTDTVFVDLLTFADLVRGGRGAPRGTRVRALRSERASARSGIRQHSPRNARGRTLTRTSTRDPPAGSAQGEAARRRGRARNAINRLVSDAES